MKRCLLNSFVLLGVLFLFTISICAQSNTNAPSPQNSSASNATNVSSDVKFEGPIAEGAWVTNSEIPVPNGYSQTTTAASDDGLIYVIGGGTGAGPDATLGQVWSYDPGADAWTRVSDYLTTIRAFGAAVQLGGFIYVFGGYDGTNPSNITGIYDIANDAWSQGANIPVSGRFGSAVGLVNVPIAGSEGSIPLILVAGGASTVILNDAYLYDPSADAFTPIASLPAGFSTFRIHGVCLDDLQECHVFAGGFTGFLHFIYDVATNTWRSGPLMPIGVTDPAVVAVGDLIYVLGADMGAPGRTQIFDAVAGTWSLGPNMPGPVNNTSGANDLAFGSIFVEGGFNGTTSIPTNYSLGVK